MGITVRYVCGTCDYPWSRKVLPMKAGKVVVMDLPIVVPVGPCCRKES